MAIRNRWVVHSWECCRGKAFGRRALQIGKSLDGMGLLFSFDINANKIKVILIAYNFAFSLS
jgi:hypothetical protein